MKNNTNEQFLNCVPLPEYKGKLGLTLYQSCASDDEDVLDFLNELSKLTGEGSTIINCGVNGSASEPVRLWAILAAKAIE